MIPAEDLPEDLPGDLPEPFRSIIAAAQVAPLDREAHLPTLKLSLTQLREDDITNRHAVLSMICQTTEAKFSQSKSLADADAAVQANEDLLALLRSQPDSNPHDLSQAYHNLAVALGDRHKLRGNPNKAADLQSAIKNSRDAIALGTSSFNPELPEYLMLLGNTLRISAENTRPPRAVSHIEEAVETLRKAVELAKREHSSMLSSCYDRYGMALQHRYDLCESGGESKDLDEAIKAHQEAANHSLGDDQKGGYLSNLANARIRRFHHNGAVHPEDLEQALEESEEAVRITSPGHFELPGRLVNFANALHVSFNRGGRRRIQDLHRAVDLNRKAVSAARATRPGHLDHAECLASLGLALNWLYDATGAEQHLDDAIKVIRESLTVLPKTSAERSKYLYSLGCCMKEKFHLSERIVDLDEAIRILQQAMEQTPSEHKDQLTYMTVLSNAYGDRSRFDLDESIRLGKMVIDQCKRRHVTQFRSAYLTNLAGALANRYRSNKSMNDLSAAIDAQQEALDFEYADPSHPLRAVCLHNLGIFLIDRYVAQGKRNQSDRDRAIGAHVEASRIPSASPAKRIEAARRAMNIIGATSGDVGLSVNVMREAVELLPFLSPATLNRDEQQRGLAAFSGLASRAAALALNAGMSPSEALRLLELGRGVMTATQMGLRGDLKSVEQADGKLASRFRELRDRLNAAPSSLVESIPAWDPAHLSGAGGSHEESNSDNKHAIWDELQEVVSEIRKLQVPECSTFASTLSEEDMKAMAEEGPIVVFNTDPIRSDAFLITGPAAPIQHIHLDKLKYENLKDYAQLARELVENQGTREFVKTGRSSRRGNAAKSMGSILKWLWDSAVGPVLEVLGIWDPQHAPDSIADRENEVQVERRVWWVTSGPLSTLPIQAAGDYSPGSGPNTIDLVISSYAPTLKSLWYARRKAAREPQSLPRQALLIKMKDTPGQLSLPGVETEVQGIDGILPPTIRREIPQKPTKNSTLNTLRTCHICHLACHGQSHGSNPSSSGFILTDPETPLTVGDIAQLDLDHAQLAYLSACSAADNRVSELLDENLHLAAAFLLAGFPTVVGTLWQIRDSMSAEVAADFYRGICVGAPANDADYESPAIEVGRSARSLNVAVRSLRKKLGDRPDAAIIWAPYIHLGV
ncbi:hypothetical protein DL769_002160 [Monosporascus sp. CRB-8-3]|nr:hypothetical protein DL769_002160 [Monosporascus sp. CRB-8-3]